MTDTGPDEYRHQPLKDFDALRALLTANLINALSAASKPEGGKRKAKLTDAAMHQRTGLARTTLRRLRSSSADGKMRVPQLETLFEVAKQIGIPLPFLLMSPHDWQIMGAAILDLRYYAETASKIVGSEATVPHDTAWKVLQSCLSTSAEPVELSEMRQRACLVLGSQMLPGARTSDAAKLLCALSAAIAHQSSAAAYRAGAA